MEKQIHLYSQQGNLIILGDINARTSQHLDHVYNDSDKLIPELISYDIDDNMPVRYNQDKILNDRGTTILDLCISSGLRIVNGRKPGDSIGYYTCHKYNGSSVVDYCIASENLFKDILYFHVHNNLTDLSHHCQISTCIQNVNFTRKLQSKVETKQISRGFIWEDNSPLLFQRALRAMDNSITHFLNTQYEYLPDEIDRALNNFNNIVVNAADQSLKRSRVNLKKKSQKNSKKWYVPSLRQMKNEIKKLGRILCSKPYDQNVREKYHRALKCYKRQCKKEQRAYRANIINKMENLQTENPKVYWKLVEELSDKYKMGSKIEIEKLFSHYTNINTIVTNLWGSRSGPHEE